eukprot:ANDGO_01164.mRNA.1 hydrolase
MFFDTPNGIHLHYETTHWEQGDRVTLLLIHSGSSSLRTWRLFLSQATVSDLPKFRTVAVDLRGHGKTAWLNTASPDTCSSMNSPDCAADIVELLQHLSVKKFFIVAWSLGGRVAELVAATVPEYVTGMALYSPVPSTGLVTPGGVSPEDMLHAMRELWKTGMQGNRAAYIGWGSGKLPEVWDAIEADIFEDSSVYQAVESSVLLSYIKNCAESVRNVLSEVQCPVLLITGDRDVFMSHVLDDFSCAKWGGPVHLHCIHGASHLGPFEYATEFYAAVMRFLRSIHFAN